MESRVTSTIFGRLAVASLAGATACALLALPAPALADRLYKYVDRDGVTVLSNVAPGARSSLAKRGAALQTAAPRAPRGRSTAEFDLLLQEACDLYNIPFALARAVVAAESAFDPFAVSAKGAMGLMQLMPATASEMFVLDAFDPKQNIHGGVRYLRILANMFDGDMVRMIAAYNAGPEAVRRASGIPAYAETQEYVRRVMRFYFEFKRNA